MIGAVVELLGLLVLAGAAVGVVRSLRRVGTAVARPVAPASWEPHVGAADNHTVVTVRRGAESLEIARFPADDPDWHDKLVTARADAALRAAELNAPY